MTHHWDTTTWVEQAAVTLDADCLMMRVVNNSQLWCLCCDGDDPIVIYDINTLTKVKTLGASISDVGAVHDVADLGDGDVVLAASTGLYHLQDAQSGN